MTQMKGLMLYNEYMEGLQKLPAEDFKNLFVNLHLYNQGKEIGELTPMAELFWPIYAAKVDQMRESYERRCQKNRENARRRKSRGQTPPEQEPLGEAEYSDAQETAYFSDTSTEHMNCNAADSAPKTAEQNRTNADEHQPLSMGERTEANGYRMEANGKRMEANRCQHNITETETETVTKTETETETETKTETETETITEAVTETKTKTVSVTQAQAQAVSDVEQSRSCDGIGGGIDCGIGIGCGGSGIEESNKKDFRKPTREEVRRYCGQYALLVDADRFYQYYEERGWCANGEPIQSWRAMADHWQKLGEDQRAAKQASREDPRAARQTFRDDAPFSSEPKANYDLDAFVRASMERPFDFEPGY